MKNENKAEASTARIARNIGMMFAEQYANKAESCEDLEMTSQIFTLLRDNIITPETLSTIGDLLNDISAEVGNLTGDHEAEYCEQICDTIAVSLGEKYSHKIGRG